MKTASSIALPALSEGREALLAAVRAEPTYANHCRVLDRLRSGPVAALGPALRVAMLNNFTIEPLMTCVRVQAYMQGVAADFYVAPYNEHAQEILDPARELHAFNADVVMVFLAPGPVLGGVLAEPWQGGTARQESAEAAYNEVAALLGALRERSGGALLVANFVAPFPSPLGTYDWQEAPGIRQSVEQINHRLADWARAQDRVYVFDLAGICAAYGLERAFDGRLRLLADQPFATAFLPRLGAEVVRYLRATQGPARKCLVLDLDNTLWGGILGEDGAERLRLGGDAVGEAFREFQQAVLALHHRGILLALCSRNDEREAMAVIREHPAMVLRPEHFAAARIDYGDKVANLQSITGELNVGLDSLVFMDDDPFECSNVRERLPEVLAVPLPPDPALYRSALLGLSVFDTLWVSAEDRARGRMYQEQRVRAAERDSAGSLEEYLRNLRMEITAVPAEGSARVRLFQLAHKTNQFNLTTRRYTEAEFDGLTRSPLRRVFGIQVRDRLGDSGIVGLVVLRLAEGCAEIETFLLSCRVLGRSIETGVLAYLLKLARELGAKRVRGCYIPTAKNGLVRDFYARHGFVSEGSEGDGEWWAADLDSVAVAAPPWAPVREPEAAR